MRGGSLKKGEGLSKRRLGRSGEGEAGVGKRGAKRGKAKIQRLIRHQFIAIHLCRINWILVKSKKGKEGTEKKELSEPFKPRGLVGF